MKNGKQVSVMGISKPIFLNLIMAIYTYIPAKNCNIVQNDADVAIMSLNPSIVNYQTVDFCTSRKKETDNT
jgi:hypothetical protein